MLLPLEVPADCNCCSNPAILSWHSAAREIEPALSRLTFKADGLTDDGEDGTDNFTKEELAIAAILALEWSHAVKSAKDVLLGAVKSVYSIGTWQNAVASVSSTMSSIFTTKAKTTVTSSIKTASGTGAHEVMKSSPATNPSAETFNEALIKAISYAADNHWSAQVLPAIQAAIDNLFGDHTSAPSIEDIQNAISSRLGDSPYWALVANVAASRAYHYGMLKTMENQRILAYQFVAVIDDKTSSVCRAMNGKQFLVADAINILDGLAQDQSPDAAKRRTPWVRASVIHGKTNEELAAMGVIVPPLHPLCRSTITALQ